MQWEETTVKSIATATAVIALANVFGIAQAAADACDISTLACKDKGNKCNIRFRNLTGEGSGSGGGTKFNQASAAETIYITAIQDDGSKAGSNRISIDDLQDKTMNLDKKTDFAYIRIQARTKAGAFGGDNDIKMGCGDIKATLEGNGVCKVFIHEKDELSQQGFKVPTYNLVYTCDGQNVQYNFKD